MRDATNPNDPETVGNLGVMLGFQGQYSEAQPLLELAIERSTAPAPRYYQFMALAFMMKDDWDGMLSGTSYAVANDSGFGYALAAIAHGSVGNAQAARENLAKMAERWPQLAADPRATLASHRLDPAVIEVFVSGLRRSGLQ